VQDLHGYDKPWAGGNGKNKLNWFIHSRDKTGDGITFTESDDGIIDIDGTATNDNTYSLVFTGAEASAFSNMILNGIGVDIGVYLRLEKRYSPYTKYATDYGNGATIGEIPLDGGDCILYIRVLSGITCNHYKVKPMIRLASVTDATFEPYSNICPISGSTSVTVTISDGETSTTKTTPLGQTVYGGQLNVLTGELTIDRAFLQIDGDSTIAWATQSSWTAGCWYNGTIMAGAKNISGYGTKANIISNMGEAQTPSDLANNVEFGVAHGNGTTLYARVDNTLDTVDKFRTFLNNSPLQIVYELATPQTVQLTPQEVNSLLGQNNISADTGDVDIVYVKASAPIQPNPTGTPTATLKKLGIERAVFELPSEGGGSSSGINYSTTEQVIGTWIDGKPLYAKTIEVHNLVSGNNTISHNIANLKMTVENISFLIDNNNYTNQMPAISTVSGWSARARDFGLTTFVIELGSEIARYYTDAIVTMFYTKITD
jgi:hypothetical protein